MLTEKTVVSYSTCLLSQSFWSNPQLFLLYYNAASLASVPNPVICVPPWQHQSQVSCIFVNIWKLVLLRLLCLFLRNLSFSNERWKEVDSEGRGEREELGEVRKTTICIENCMRIKLFLIERKITKKLKK